MCGKPISNRGKRLHDDYCPGRTSTRSNTVATRSSTRSSRSFPSLKIATPGTAIQATFYSYLGWIDYCYKKLINNPMFFWFWGSILVFSVVAPAYIVQLLFNFVESLFAIVAIFWRASVNIVGGTVATTQQMNKLANEFQKPEYKGVVPLLVNKLFGEAQKANETALIKHLAVTVADAAYNSVVGSVNTTNTASALELQVNATKKVFNRNWGSMIFGNAELV